MSSNLHKYTPHCKTRQKVVKLQLKKKTKTLTGLQSIHFQFLVTNHWSTKCAVVREDKGCSLHWAKVCKYHSPETAQGTAAACCAGDRIYIPSCLSRAVAKRDVGSQGKGKCDQLTEDSLACRASGLRSKVTDKGLWKLLQSSIPAINLGSSSLAAADRPCPTSCW